MQKLKNIWPLFLLPIILLAFFGDTLSVLNTAWIQWDQAYSHGYLIIGLVAFWVGREARDLGLYADKTLWILAVIFLGGTLFAWYTGRVIQLRVLEQASLLGIGWAWMWVVGGWRLAKHLIAPFAIGLLAIPLWDVMISPLQDLTVYVVAYATELLGITAYLEENKVELPYGILVIADGCAGLNLFLVSLSIGLIYSYMYLVRPVSMAICISSLLFLGVFTNWLRVFSLVLIGYYTKMESRLVYEHGTYGWVLFAGVLIVFFFLYRKVERTARPKAKEEHPAIPLTRPAIWVALALLIAVPTWAAYLSRAGAQAPVARLLEGVNLPIQEVQQPLWKPQMSGYDLEQHWRFGDADYESYLSIFSYTNQRQGKELIYYSNKIAEKYDLKTVELAALQSDDFPPMATAIVRAGEQRYLVLWVYKVGPWYTSSQIEAKLLQLPVSFMSNRSAELMVLSIACEGIQTECDIEREKVQQEDYRKGLESLYAAVKHTKLVRAGG